MPWRYAPVGGTSPFGLLSVVCTRSAGSPSTRAPGRTPNASARLRSEVSDRFRSPRSIWPMNDLWSPAAFDRSLIVHPRPPRRAVMRLPNAIRAGVGFDGKKGSSVLVGGYRQIAVTARGGGPRPWFPRPRHPGRHGIRQLVRGKPRNVSRNRQQVTMVVPYSARSPSGVAPARFQEPCRRSRLPVVEPLTTRPRGERQRAACE